MIVAKPHCSFCAEPHEAAELLFRSPIGGLPPFICAGCVEGFAEIVRVHRDSPERAASLIAAHNARAPLFCSQSQLTVAR